MDGAWENDSGVVVRQRVTWKGVVLIGKWTQEAEMREGCAGNTGLGCHLRSRAELRCGQAQEEWTASQQSEDTAGWRAAEASAV